MKMYTQTNQKSNDDIALLVAQNISVSKNQIFPFADAREFLTELFQQHDCDNNQIISIGAVTPDLAIAVDKANMSIQETSQRNPFSYNIDHTLDSFRNGDIVYISNPNKITGANFSLSALKTIATKNSEGIVLIDEYYFDYFGISAISLINEFENIIVLRSFTAAFGIYSSDAGYAVSSLQIINQLHTSTPLKQISTILRKTILATSVNKEATNNRLKEIHDEALRITTALTALGIQCRITATDFLLIRVASPKDVGNYLKSNKVDIENLSGYPEMENYIRYRIESFFTNERIIKAFEEMPHEYYKMKSAEKRSITLRRPHGEIAESEKNIENLLQGKIKERSTTPQTINSKHLFKIAD